MKLKAIRQEARFRLDDEVRPYFWKDEWLDAAINEAEREACIRARLIEDNSSNVTSLDIVTTEKRYELSPLIIDVLAIEMASRPGCNIAGWTLTESERVLDNYPSSSDTLTPADSGGCRSVPRPTRWHTSPRSCRPRKQWPSMPR